jgi:hypothetical protein
MSQMRFLVGTAFASSRGRRIPPLLDRAELLLSTLSIRNKPTTFRSASLSPGNRVAKMANFPGPVPFSDIFLPALLQ